MTGRARALAIVTLAIGSALCPAWLLGGAASAAAATTAAATTATAASATTVPPTATTGAATSSPAAATTIAEPDPGAFGALPRPNTGVKPQASGDRGGAAQLALLGILTAGLAIIGVVIARSTKQHTRSRAIDQ